MMEFPVTLRVKPAAWAESIRPHLLRTINGLRPAFTAKEVADAVPSHRLQDVIAFLDRLVERDLLEKDGAVYTAATDQRIDAESLAARKQQHMWNILRGSQGRPSIDVESLALLASTAQVPIGKTEAGRYVAALVAGRFLRERTPGRYWLPPERVAGPLAPRLMQVTFLIEPNKWSLPADLVAREARL